MIPQFLRSLSFLFCLAITFSLNAQQEVAIVAVHSNFSFDVDHASYDNGAAIRQQENLKNDNQLWEMIEVTDGIYRFKARHSGKFLAAPTNGAIGLTQQADADGPGQQFSVIDLRGGEYYLRHLGTGRFVGVAKGSNEPGYRIVLQGENINYAQKFRLEERYQHVNIGRPAAPVTYSFSVRNSSMWDVSFRVLFGNQWSAWKYADVSLNSKEVSLSSEASIQDYEIRWKDLTTWKKFPGGLPIIPDNASMSIKVSGNTLTGIKAN